MKFPQGIYCKHCKEELDGVNCNGHYYYNENSGPELDPWQPVYFCVNEDGWETKTRHDVTHIDKLIIRGENEQE